MQIEYKLIRYGYARIDKNGELLITIPVRKKGSEFEKIMIQKGEALFKRYNKKTHITPIQEDCILLFGEQVPIEDIYQQYTIKKTEKNRTKILKEILEDYATPILTEYSQKLGINYQKLSTRKTISKRGSCTYDQKISLNLDLVHLPTKYIKYVIIHEACHLKEKNHGKKFRTLVEGFCPEYKETKKELKKFILK